VAACRVVAEVAQAHDGSLGTAHAYIDAAADRGAHAIKFQTHIADAESTPSEPWRIPFSLQDDSRYDYWRRMEFPEHAWAGLYSHAVERGLEFICSPFSIEAVELLRRTGIDAWKIASGEVANESLLRAVADDGRPVILSSGMSGLAELDRAVGILRDAGTPLTVLQCTSAYPTPPEAIGLNLIGVLSERYGVPTGLSDHSGTIYAGIAAAALGAAMVEVHVTFSRASFGPDVVASITLEELGSLVAGIDFVGRSMAAPVDKDAAADDLTDIRALFTRSVVARRDLPEGHVLTASDLIAKKPGTGIPAAKMPAVIGRRLTRPVRRDDLLADSDLDRGVMG
jgi:N,N'-diacetyllegionaminate synthase